MKLIPIQKDGTVGVDAGQLPVFASDVLEATVNLYARSGFSEPWICYIAVEDGRAVGTCGFKSAPSEARVEIAYFTFPGFEGRGVATGMAAELMALADQADPSVTVAAQTLPERNASHRVLEKHQFTCVGKILHPEDGIVLEWQRLRRDVA